MSIAQGTPERDGKLDRVKRKREIESHIVREKRKKRERVKCLIFA